jgi:uncharacterized membrane protein
MKGQVRVMSKNEFLLRLKEHTSKEEGERLYHYYSEIIEDRIEGGEDEVAIIASLGDVDKIIQEAEASRKVRDFEERPRLSTGFKALIAVLLVFASPLVLAIALPLVMTVVILAFSLLIVLFSLVISFFAAGVAGIAGIVIGIVTLFTAPAAGLFQIGTGLVALGLGVIICFLTVKLTKVTLIGIKKLFGVMIRKFSRKSKGGGNR